MQQRRRSAHIEGDEIVAQPFEPLTTEPARRGRLSGSGVTQKKDRAVAHRNGGRVDEKHASTRQREKGRCPKKRIQTGHDEAPTKEALTAQAHPSERQVELGVATSNEGPVVPTPIDLDRYRPLDRRIAGGDPAQAKIRRAKRFVRWPERMHA